MTSWLPPSVRARAEEQDRAEVKAGKAEQEARAARAEEAHNRAVSAYLADAASRGEQVSPMDVATGNIGYTVGEAIERHQELADRPPKEQRPEKDYELLFDGEPVIRSRGRGREPLLSYEAERAIRRARENDEWMLAYKVKRDYPAALEAARAKSEAGSGNAIRSRLPAAGERVQVPPNYGEISRVCGPGGNIGLAQAIAEMNGMEIL